MLHRNHGITCSQVVLAMRKWGGNGKTADWMSRRMLGWGQAQQQPGLMSRGLEVGPDPLKRFFGFVSDVLGDLTQALNLSELHCLQL